MVWLPSLAWGSPTLSALAVEDLDGLAAVVGIAFAGADLGALVVEDLDGLVALVLLVEPDLERVVVLDDAVEVLLGVEVDLLRVLLVLEAELVEVVGRSR